MKKALILTVVVNSNHVKKAGLSPSYGYRLQIILLTSCTPGELGSSYICIG